MNRKLYKEDRAPLPYILNAMRGHEKSIGTNVSYAILNEELIRTLHMHNWSKRDYISARNTHEQELQKLGFGKPPVSCFKR